MKLCRDCRYIMPDYAGLISENSRCANPRSKNSPHLVTGEQSQAYAINVRLRPNACGTEGLWFEPQFVPVPESIDAKRQ